MLGWRYAGERARRRHPRECDRRHDRHEQSLHLDLSSRPPACPVSPVVIRPYPTCDTNGAPPTAEYKLRAVRRTTPIAIRLLTMSVLSSPTVGDRSRGRTSRTAHPATMAPSRIVETMSPNPAMALVVASGPIRDP